jgi:hypothetical protein
MAEGKIRLQILQQPNGEDSPVECPKVLPPKKIGPTWLM